MLKVIVHWSKDIAVEDLKLYKERTDEYLYLVLRKRSFLIFGEYKPLYIGMAYRQSIYRRLKAHHKLNRIIKHSFGLGKIVIRTGMIELPTASRISQDLVGDVESVLIINEQTRYNAVSRKGYNGRILEVANKGNYRPLHRRINSVKLKKRRYASGFGVALVLLMTIAMFYFSFTDTGYQMLVRWVDYALGEMNRLWSALAKNF